MREIKFRAWQDNQIITQPLSNNYGAARFFGFFYEDVPVMQYTGLKDNNGKEVYESDLIYIAGYGLYEVEFPFVELYEANCEGDIGEIKGNIYENPELLENT